jgi:hypothetical protein
MDPELALRAFVAVIVVPSPERVAVIGCPWLLVRLQQEITLRPLQRERWDNE